jgi:signal transduction histidine kinase
LIVSGGVGGLAGTAVGLFYTRAVREAAEARRARDSVGFLNRTLRHELLNSVNVIEGNAALLAETVEDPEATDRVEAIRSQAETIDSLVGDLRPLARMVAGETAAEPTDLGATVEAAVETTRGSFPAVEITTDVPAVDVAANDALERVFENILANAVEHNDADTPEIEVGATVESDTVTVRIADNGPGIPDDRMEAIFEADAADEGGFGLFFVRTTVETFDGAVRAENTPDGAAFVFELPRAAA